MPGQAGILGYNDSEAVGALLWAKRTYTQVRGEPNSQRTEGKREVKTILAEVAETSESADQPCLPLASGRWLRCLSRR